MMKGYRVELSNGTAMPALGLGTYKTPDGHPVEQAVTAALEAGYRCVDTASFYGNEAGIGRALAGSGVPREELFITTKVWNSEQGHGQALEAFQRSIEKLGLDYLDLYLISGNPGRLERAVYWAWAGLPFVYLWHAHNREVMRYATVPYFAVTRMDKRPWFGVAAQWVGLRYAYELFRLSRFDRSVRWGRIGRAITLCACLLYTSPSPRDRTRSRMPSSA